MKKLEIAGVTVLYQPQNSLLDNINSYLEKIEKLFIVDNSESINTEVYNILIQNKKVEYIFHSKNLGISKALNIGATKALNEGFNFLLTMDQDTSIDSKLIDNYKNFLLSTSFNNIGMITPIPSYIPNGKKEKIKIKEMNVAITSGSLLNLNAFEKVGPYLEDLFIDYLDFEYCLRLRKNGYKIIQLSSCNIRHQLGNLERRYFLFKPIFVTHHSPIRYYYRTRNRLYVAKNYITSFPLFVLKDIFIFINELIKIAFFEDEKTAKFKMVVFGVIDFLKKRYGKFESIYY